MDLLSSVGFALAYGLVGIAVIGVGYYALDLLTPGHLGSHIMRERSTNAAIVAASGVLGLGIVVFTAIWTNGESAFGTALGWTVAFGLVGVLMQAVSFRLLDVVLPDDLAAIVTEPQFHPAALVAAANQLAVSLVVVACIA